MRPISRIYQPVVLVTGMDVELTEQAGHHVARVLRATVGDSLVLFNGQGGEFLAAIIQITKKSVVVRVGEFENRCVESPLQLVIAQGISRGEKMDYTIQKAVELGVTHIVPLLTERCTVKLDEERKEKRLQHWQAIVVGACEQSGRNRLPEIVSPQPLQHWIAQVASPWRFVLSPHVDKKLSERVIPADASVVLLVGPEGGLSEKEMALAEMHHFLPLNLGPRVLRTETAAVAAMTALQCCFGDMT